jgi:4,5-DOPA dioxygenase extradiol
VLRHVYPEADVPVVHEYEKLGREALLSIPTPDHYLPLLYVIATRQDSETIGFPVSVQVGADLLQL